MTVARFVATPRMRVNTTRYRNLQTLYGGEGVFSTPYTPYKAGIHSNHNALALNLQWRQKGRQP